MENGIVKVMDENGKEKEYKILFTFSDEETNENYVVYTDYSVNENGNINVYSNLYKETNSRTELLPVERMEIKKFIDEKLEEIKNDIINGRL